MIRQFAGGGHGRSRNYWCSADGHVNVDDLRKPQVRVHEQQDRHPAHGPSLTRRPFPHPSAAEQGGRSTYLRKLASGNRQATVRNRAGDRFSESATGTTGGGTPASSSLTPCEATTPLPWYPPAAPRRRRVRRALAAAESLSECPMAPAYRPRPPLPSARVVMIMRIRPRGWGQN